MPQLKDTLVETLHLNMKGSTNKLRPAFCFRYLVKDFDFDNLLTANNQAHYKDFLNKIKSLSGLDWETIKNSNRYGNGAEKIDHSSLKQFPLKCITPDMSILVFHLSGLFRIIGVRDGKVFYVLYIDPNGRAYKH
jgi:hypothetical protein